MKYAAILCVLMLAGCMDGPPARPYVKAGATADDERVQEAKCRMASREIAFSPREKEKGHEVESFAREFGQYQDCMTAAGYTQ